MSVTFLYCKYSETPEKLLNHYHNAFELLFVVNGFVDITIGDKQFHATQGSMFFINNFEEHSVDQVSSDYARYYAIFPVKMANKVVADARLMSIFKNRTSKFQHMLRVENGFLKIHHLFELLLEEREIQDEHSQEMISMYLKQILTIVYRENPERFSSVYSETQSRMRQVQIYLDEHFAEDISIANLAEQSYLSMYYFSRAFKEFTGYSPKQYLLMTRLSSAKDQLISENNFIHTISHKCGFNDVNNFIRCFKREFSVTPKQYRDTSRENY